MLFDTQSFITDEDNEDIHFNMNVHRQRMYCMRHHDEGSAVSSPRSISNIAERRPDNTSHSELIADAFKSFWKTGNVLRLTSRESSSKKHRFLEVTDPSLDHIISQSRAKAITSEDDLIAEMLKKEAYRVATAHTLGSASKKSCQVFYTEGDVHNATHHSPVNPIFYESKARSVKVDPPLKMKSTVTAADQPSPSSSSLSSSSLPVIDERNSARSIEVSHSTTTTSSSTGGYTVRDNCTNARRQSSSIIATGYSSPEVSPSNRWGRSDASVIS